MKVNKSLLQSTRLTLYLSPNILFRRETEAQVWASIHVHDFGRPGGMSVLGRVSGLSAVEWSTNDLNIRISSATNEYLVIGMSHNSSFVQSRNEVGLTPDAICVSNDRLRDEIFWTSTI